MLLIEHLRRKVKGVGAACRALFPAGHTDAELAAELQWHLQQLIRDKVRAGLPLKAAEREARLQFGPLESIKERCRDSRRWAAVKRVLDDLRAGYRIGLKHPQLNVPTICTVAFVVAVASTAFAVLDATLFRPTFPGIQSRGLFTVIERSADGSPTSFSYSHFLRLKALAAESFDIAAEQQAFATVKTSSTVETVTARNVSPNLLRVLGTSVSAGRDLSPADPAEQQVCWLAFEFAARHFAAPTDAIGQQLVIDDVLRTVVGVLPKHFYLVTEVLLPLRRNNPAGDLPGLVCFVRGKRHNQNSTVEADLDAILKQVGAESGAAISGAVVRPFGWTLAHHIRPQLWALAAATLLALVTGCGTAINLSSAKLSTRWNEVTLRCALGATRRRIAAQWIIEELLLTIPATILGLVAAAFMLRWVRSIAFGAIHPAARIGLSAAAAIAGISVAILLICITAITVAAVLARKAVPETISSTAYRASLSRAMKSRWLNLVSLQTVFTVVTFAAACLLLGDIVKLRRTDMGFRSTDLFLLQVPTAERLLAEAADTAAKLEQTVVSTPGVRTAAFSAGIPIFFLDPVSFAVTGQGGSTPARGVAMLYATTPRLLGTLGITLLEGRFFTSADTASSQPVAVVDESFAENQFPTTTPIGQSIVVTVRGESTPVTVVGVVRHISQQGPTRLARGEGQIYRPFVQLSRDAEKELIRAGAHLVWRVAKGANDEAVSKLVAAKVHQFALEEPMPVPETMRDRIGLALNPQRTWLILFGFSAAAALLLSGIGIYAVTTSAVAAQLRESCIRIALGCSRRHLLATLCGPVAKRVLLGVVAGGAIALATNRLLATQLSLANDSAFSSGVAAIAATICVAAAGCLIPSRGVVKRDVSSVLSLT